MNKRVKQILMITAAGCILLTALFFVPLKASSVNEFPVPITASVQDESSTDQASYEWTGINRIYRHTVKLRGWKEVDQMGSMYIHEKDGERVGLITFKNGFSLTELNPSP